MARLARLAFEPSELDNITEQLGRILEHVGRLESLDTSVAAPTATVVMGVPTPLREDEPWGGLSRDEAVEPAPSVQDGYFKVPRIIE